MKLEQRGVYLKLSTEQITTMKYIVRHNKGLKMVQLIRTFLDALKDMDGDCKIIIYDKHRIRSIDHFQTIVDAHEKYGNLDLRVRLDNGFVSMHAAGLRTMGGKLE